MERAEGDREVQTTAEEEEPPNNTRQSNSRIVCARQLAVNFMPSRQLPYNTLRHRRNNSENNGLLDETDNADGDGTDDEEHATEEKKAQIIVKELEQQHQLMENNPLSEELRREVLRDLPQGLTMKRTVRAKLSASVSLRSRSRPISLFRRTKYRISFAWKRSKERIRDALFSIELWYEAIRKIEGQFGSAVGSYFRTLRRLVALDAALALALLAALVLPQGLHSWAALYNNIDDEGHWLVNWIRESFYSVMFYGDYAEGDVGSATLPYNMPFAYFFTMLCLYLIFFAVLCYKTAYSYRRNFIETSGGVSHVFANKVFCGWDFGIITSHAADLNARSIYNELKELLSEQNNKTTSLTFWRKLGQTVTNVTISVLVLTSIGGLLFGLWKLLEGYRHWEGLLSMLLVAVASICPMIFHFLGRLEYYSPRTALYVALSRTWLLDVGTMMLLFVFWSSSDQPCWESRFGQEVYRLVWLDSVISLLVLPAIEAIRALIYKCYPAGDPPEFNIAYNSLTLIYNQSILWFGMLFSPLLSLAVTIKLLLLFYIKRECAMRACQPARKVWRAAQTQTVLFMLITLSLFTAIFGIGSLFLRMPSKQCGPFGAYSHVFAVFSEGLLRLHEREKLRLALSWLYRPGVVALAVLLLTVLVYYSRARARAEQSMVAILRHMLVLQAKDKDFLLTAIANVSNGEWLYSPKPTDEGPDSHTVRYLRDVRKPSNSSFHFDGSRLSRSFADRPRSQPQRPVSGHVDRSHNDGDTDSSFSWQGSGNNLNDSMEN